MGFFGTLGDAWDSTVDFFTGEEEVNPEGDALWIDPGDPTPKATGGSGGLPFIGPKRKNTQNPLVEDIEKVKSIFDREVEGMTKRGERHPFGPLNNMASIFDDKIKTCSQQADCVKEALEKEDFNEGWKFDIKGHRGWPHWWVEGRPDREYGQYLQLDPWKNTFQQKQDPEEYPLFYP